MVSSSSLLSRDLLFLLESVEISGKKKKTMPQYPNPCYTKGSCDGMILTTTSKPKIVRSSFFLSQVAASVTSFRSISFTGVWFAEPTGKDFKLWR